MSDTVPWYAFKILDAFLNGTGLDTGWQMGEPEWPTEILEHIAAHHARVESAKAQWVSDAMAWGLPRDIAEELATKCPEAIQARANRLAL